MSAIRYIKFGFDLRVIAAFLLAALAIGAINNMLAGDERQVPWSGEGIAADDARDAGSDDGADNDESGDDDDGDEEDGK